MKKELIFTTVMLFYFVQRSKMTVVIKNIGTSTILTLML